MSRYVDKLGFNNVDEILEADRRAKRPALPDDVQYALWEVEHNPLDIGEDE